MKWGKIHNKKKVTRRYKYWKSIYGLRQGIASAAGVPERYILGANVKVSEETFNEIEEMNLIFIDFWKLSTRNLPRKLKKKYRKIYRSME